MQMIAALPGLIALIWCIKKGPQQAFLQVYFPVLFLLPNYYRWVLAGLPDPTFAEACIIPIAIFYLIKRAPGWKWSFADFAVFGFAFCVGFSQFLSTGYNDAQNLIFDMLGQVVLPYVLAKGIIEPGGLRLEFAKKMVVLLGFVALTNLYEFRFIQCAYRMVLDPLFPGDMGRGWVTTERYGFGRAAGPYAHAILAGVIFATGFRVQRWLQQNGHWSKGEKTKARLLTAAMVAGMVMTQSRGPWLGAMIGSLAVVIGRAKNRSAMLAIVAALVVCVGTPAYLAFQAYVSVGRAGAESATQETAAYRKELVDNYTDIVLQKAAWGWGQNEWPKIPGMPSIDNHFLNLALRHGLIATGFFCLTLLGICFRLGMYCYNTPRTSPGSPLAFSMLAALIGLVISIVTVFLGENALMLCFVIVGWAEGLVIAREPAPRYAKTHGFRRVLA
jgi:hypothetical protein